MPPVAPCEGCCVKMVQFIGTDHYQVAVLKQKMPSEMEVAPRTDHYQVKDLKQKYHQRFETNDLLRCFMIFLRADQWGHYHIILWEEETFSKALISDQENLHGQLWGEFLHGEPRLHDWGGTKIENNPLNKKCQKTQGWQWEWSEKDCSRATATGTCVSARRTNVIRLPNQHCLS